MKNTRLFSRQARLDSCGEVRLIVAGNIIARRVFLIVTNEIRASFLIGMFAHRVEIVAGMQRRTTSFHRRITWTKDKDESSEDTEIPRNVRSAVFGEFPVVIALRQIVVQS